MDREEPSLGLGNGVDGLGSGEPESMLPLAAAAGGVATIGRKKYAVNLYWQPSPSGRVSQAARETARQPGQMADFFAVRPGNSRGRVAQFGLGQKEFGHKSGLPTGAASLAEDQPGSWAGVFKVPEGWWLVVSRDDLIAPDGDVLFADELEAKARLQDEVRLEGLQRIYAPDHWHIAGADPIPLTLLMQGRADFRLQTVRFPVKQIGIGLAVLALLGVGAYFAFGWQQDRQETFEQSLSHMTPEQAQIARLQQQSQLAPPAPPPPPERKWEKAPRPVQFLQACHQALTLAPATTLGWKQSDIVCSVGSLTIAWTREANLPAIIPPNAKVNSVTDQPISSYPLALGEVRGPETLLDPSEVTRQALLGNWPVTFSDLPDDVSPAAPPPPTVPGMPAPPPPPPIPAPWIKKKLILKSDTAPWIEWSRYANLPGLVLERISWTGGAQAAWSVEGTLYENR